jgi:GTP-binding protein Era
MNQPMNLSDPISERPLLFKVGYVAIVGRPNVGKSTLMNRLLGRKLSIVTPKPQTTRRRVLGIKTGGDHQIVFLDTPGLFEPKYLLQKIMVRAARDCMGMSDLVLWMTDASGMTDKDEKALEFLGPLSMPKFAVINKIDLFPKGGLLPLTDRFSKLKLFEEIVPVSALRKDGLDRLFTLVLNRLPAGEPFYPSDVMSDEPERFFVSEIIREQVFLQYKEEIPYSSTVQIEEFREKPGGKDYIRAVIFVEHDSQKGIVIGRGGQALKKVGQKSREAAEAFLGRPVFLELFVKVKPGWRSEPGAMREFGYA